VIDWTNATFDRVRQIAIWQGDDRIAITVRSDGRVTISGESGSVTNWRREADLFQSSVLPPPNKVLHEMERKGAGGKEKWGG
jgi:hypothetical protein